MSRPLCSALAHQLGHAGEGIGGDADFGHQEGIGLWRGRGIAGQRLRLGALAFIGERLARPGRDQAQSRGLGLCVDLGQGLGAQGLEGGAELASGPMGELHDATTALGAAALFRFLGIDADRRRSAGTALLTRACVDQLVRLFGDEAGRPAATLLMDWSAEAFTATADDRRGRAHPVPQRGPWVSGVWRERLTLAGSETSATDPSYLAGAMDAASRTAAEVLQWIAVPGRAA